VTPEFTVDHLLYLTDRRHRRATHAAFRRASRKRGLMHVSILHEADGSCCARESWAVTAGRIHRALSDDGERTAWALVGEQAAAVLLPGEAT
jgi:hypothetical protein